MTDLPVKSRSLAAALGGITACALVVALAAPGAAQEPDNPYLACMKKEPFAARDARLTYVTEPGSARAVQVVEYSHRAISCCEVFAGDGAAESVVEVELSLDADRRRGEAWTAIPEVSVEGANTRLASCVASAIDRNAYPVEYQEEGEGTELKVEVAFDVGE